MKPFLKKTYFRLLFCAFLVQTTTPNLQAIPLTWRVLTTGALFFSALLRGNNAAPSNKTYAYRKSLAYDEGELLLAGNSAQGPMLAKFNFDTDGEPSIDWVKTFGQANGRLTTICHTLDDLLITGGIENEDRANAFIANLSTEGTFNWFTTLPSEGHSYGWDLAQVSGGIVIAGETNPNNKSDLLANDALVVKIDLDGHILWNTVIKGVRGSYLKSILTTDQGLVCTGSTNSDGIHSDLLFSRLSPDGILLQFTSINTTATTDHGEFMVATPNGFVVVGYSQQGAQTNILVSWFDTEGGFMQAKSIGTTEESLFAQYIALTTTGNLAITGWTNSSTGNTNLLFLELRPTGSLVQALAIGGNSTYVGYYGNQTTDGHFLIAGYMYYNETLQENDMVLNITSAGLLGWAGMLNSEARGNCFTRLTPHITNITDIVRVTDLTPRVTSPNISVSYALLAVSTIIPSVTTLCINTSDVSGNKLIELAIVSTFIGIVVLVVVKKCCTKEKHKEKEIYEELQPTKGPSDEPADEVKEEEEEM